MAAPNKRAARPSLDRALAAFEVLQQRLMAVHAAEFTTLDITMAQAKLLYVVMAVGELSMSEIAQQLGVTVSTASGAVDRLVELGLLARSDDPNNRRQVRVSVTAFGDGDTRADPRAQHAPASNAVRAGERRRPRAHRPVRSTSWPTRRPRASHPPHPQASPGARYEPPQRARRRQRQRQRCCLRRLPFIAGSSRPGRPRARNHCVPTSRFPIVTVITPCPGAGATDVTEQVDQADRAGHLGPSRSRHSSSPRASRSVRSRGSPVRLRSRSGFGGHDHGTGPSRAPRLPQKEDVDPVGAGVQLRSHPDRHRLRLSPGRDRPRRSGQDGPNGDHPRPSLRSRASRMRTSPTTWRITSS